MEGEEEWAGRRRQRVVWRGGERHMVKKERDEMWERTCAGRQEKAAKLSHLPWREWAQEKGQERRVKERRLVAWW